MEVMKTTKLTKYYGKVRGIKELDLDSNTWGILWLHWPERRWKIYDNPNSAWIDCTYVG